jgi:hypothetical protein
MTDVCGRGRAGHRLSIGRCIWLAAILCMTVAASPVFATQAIVVQLDRARLIKLPERAATVVIGDPLIADLSIQPGGIAVITGKGYGATNIIIMDRDGAVLTEQIVQVSGPIDPTVVVYRGIARETYSCAPECLRRITLGDDPDYFAKTLEETVSRNTQASGIAAQGDTGGGNNRH